MSVEVRITVEGRLEQRWSAWLDGARLITVGDGTTVVSAQVADQAALHALIDKVAGLGLRLVSLTQEGDA